MSLWRALVRRRRILAWGGALCLILMVPSALALMIDDRALNGVSIWIEPLRVQASTALFLLTLAWFYAYVRQAFWRSVFGGMIAWIAVTTGLFEVGSITLQAALGQASHFADGDPFHAAMSRLAGLAAVLLTLTAPLLAIGVARASDSTLAASYRQSVILGLVLTFALSLVVNIVQGPGNAWSRDDGDLWVAHVLGLHAMQVLPLFGWGVSALWPGRGGVVVIWIAAVAYAILTVGVALQAFG